MKHSKLLEQFFRNHADLDQPCNAHRSPVDNCRSLNTVQKPADPTATIAVPACAVDSCEGTSVGGVDDPALVRRSHTLEPSTEPSRVAEVEIAYSEIDRCEDHTAETVNLQYRWRLIERVDSDSLDAEDAKGEVVNLVIKFLREALHELSKLFVI